jgi:hypothetical protein
LRHWSHSDLLLLALASAALMSSNRKKLRNIQRRIAILILRVFRTTPTDASLVLFDLTPADYKILEITTYSTHRENWLSPANFSVLTRAR